ncbi:lipopolysaccharide heptosyltransferase II [Planctomycetota bacterium]
MKNILIIKPSSLGDIVQALPALSAMRRQYPHAKISWLVRPEFAELLKGHPHLDEIILFDRKLLGKVWHNWYALKALLSLISKLRQCRFDTVLDLQGLFRTAGLALLSGCKDRYGMRNTREFGSILYSHRVTQDQESIHVADYYMKIAQAAGAEDIEVKFILPQYPASGESAKSLLEKNNVTGNNYAVFVPSSLHRTKCWPAERFASLAEKITTQFGLSVIATGTANEKILIDDIQKVCNVDIVNLAGQTSLSELIAVQRSAKLVVSNDTGPGHIAAALGIPLVMIFGLSNPVRVLPYARPETVAGVDIFTRGTSPYNNNPAYSIDSVTFEQVYEKVREQLRSN